MEDYSADQNQDTNSQSELGYGGGQSGYNQSNNTNNGELWKQFGRESDVGKMLYSMYS